MWKVELCKQYSSYLPIDFQSWKYSVFAGVEWEADEMKLKNTMYRIQFK